MSAALYGGRIDEHAKHPRNRGALASPDAAFEATNPLCGDRLRLELQFSNDRIASARFDGEACNVSVAAASILTEMLPGLTREAARSIERESILTALGAPLRPSRLGCALLSLEALRGALK